MGKVLGMMKKGSAFQAGWQARARYERAHLARQQAARRLWGGVKRALFLGGLALFARAALSHYLAPPREGA